MALTDSQSLGSLAVQEGTVTITGDGGVLNLGGTSIIRINNNLQSAPLGANIGNNTSTLIGGTTGLAKTGNGTLTLNGTAVNTFTGGLNVNGGLLNLNFANLATPTNLIDSANALAIGGSGRLLITGKNTDTTNQTLGNVTVAAGGGSIVGNKNGGTATNIILGTLTATTSGGSLLVGVGGAAADAPIMTTTTDKNATGIYGGRVVFYNGTAHTGYDWATTGDVASPFSLSAYAAYTALPTSGVSPGNKRTSL